MSGTKKVEQGRYLFREGDAPDAMYVIKSGKFAVTKTKQTSEIVLAEIGPGAMVGEMAFFDNKPRSASVKALKDGEAIALPYKSLHAQFASFPEWAKAIMRTVNDHLRTANARIKALEPATSDKDEALPPHTITKLVAILSFVGMRYGKKEGDAVIVPQHLLRNFTIQVFGEATNKMQKLMAALSEMQLMSVEELGEQKQKISIFKPDLLFGFAEWYNDWLFKREDQQIVTAQEHLPCLRGVIHFSKQSPKNDKGLAKLNITDMMAKAQAELGYQIKSEEIDACISKGLMTEKVSEKDAIFSLVQIEELEKIVPYWEIIYKLRTVTNKG